MAAGVPARRLCVTLCHSAREPVLACIFGCPRWVAQVLATSLAAGRALHMVAPPPYCSLNQALNDDIQITKTTLRRGSVASGGTRRCAWASWRRRATTREPSGSS